jgi:hypothetical protein
MSVDPGVSNLPQKKKKKILQQNGRGRCGGD